MAANTSPTAIPLILQIGFSGSRQLFAGDISDSERDRLFAEVESRLAKTIKSIPDSLGVSEPMLCGIAQIAIGADTLFANACEKAGVPLRIFLPQHRDEFLSAVGSKGPDFDDDQKKEANRILDSENVIQIYMASGDHDRSGRFEETNLRIIQAADVSICLMRKDAEGTVAGSVGFLERAIKHDRPVLQIVVDEVDGKLTMEETWFNKELFVAPTIPKELSGLNEISFESDHGLPSSLEYIAPLKDYASAQAKKFSSRFNFSAGWILFTHVIATIVALAGLVFFSGHGHEHESGSPAVASVELSPSDQETAEQTDGSDGPDDADENNAEENNNERASEDDAGTADPASASTDNPDSEQEEQEDVSDTSEDEADQTESNSADLNPHYILWGLELLFIAFGLSFHVWLHWTHISEKWAFVRLIAETNRSVKSISGLPAELEYLFRLQLPDELRPLFKTLNVLHLNSSRAADFDWHSRKEQYMTERVEKQLKFYSEKSDSVATRRRVAGWVFTIFSSLAALLLISNFICEFQGIQFTQNLGALGILFPVIAVAAMSLAAAHDLDARFETYRSTAGFLKKQKPLIENADT
ncbi:MAG: hypothetical protein AAF456_24160, partial [Planctomycetota bacterium]